MGAGVVARVLEFFLDALVIDILVVEHVGLLCVWSSWLPAEDRIAFEIMVDQSGDRITRLAADFMRRTLGIRARA